MKPYFYCLSLREEPWKWRGAKEMLEREFKGNYTIYPGFYGPSLGLTANIAYAYNTDGTKEFMHTSQLAHFLGYMSLLRHAVLQGKKEFIVLEDDAEPCQNFKQLWSAVRKSLVQHCDVAQLEYIGDEHTPQAKLDENCKRSYYPFGAAAVWWTQYAAKLAIDSMRPVNEPTDIALMRKVYPFLRHAISTPALFVQKSRAEWHTSIDKEETAFA